MERSTSSDLFCSSSRAKSFFLSPCGVRACRHNAHVKPPPRTKPNINLTLLKPHAEPYQIKSENLGIGHSAAPMANLQPAAATLPTPFHHAWCLKDELIVIGEVGLNLRASLTVGKNTSLKESGL